MKATSARRVLALALCGAALAAGCGDLDGTGGPAPKPVVVSRQQVDRYPAGSPRHTLMAWYRGLQLGDVDPALYAPEAGVTRRELELGSGLLRSGVASSTPPRIVDVYFNENRDRARASLLTFSRIRAPNGRVDKARALAIVHLVHTPRGWLLSK